MANIFDQFDEPAPLQGPPLLRPFKADEKRPNADGSYSTEISTTWQQPDGQWVNIPSLWMSPQGPKQFEAGDEDGINTAANNFEQINGPTFQRFPDLASAEQAAKLRSSEGGAAAPAGNVFDQFDEPANPASSAPGNNIESLIRGTEPAPAAPEISTAKDVGLSALSGVPRGLAETAMFPVTLSRMVEGAGNYLYNKAENGVRYVVGADPLSDEELARRAEPMGINGYLYDAQDAARRGMDKVLHKPVTTPGKFAGTIAEFAAPGGLPSKGVRLAETGMGALRKYGSELVGNVVAPAVASEGAGQLAEGTPYEGLMRFLGAAFGNAGVAATRSYNAPGAAVRRATEGTTDAEWAAAKALQDNNTGIALSGPEAHAQARDGASKLLDLQRVVEGSTTAGNKTGPFYAQRPAQVDAAVGRELDEIAPQSPDPYALGPRAAEAAGNVIDKTRQNINAQTRPLYDAAQPQQIATAEFAPIAADPRFVAGLKRLRENKELAPDYANMPDNSVGVVDAVTKDMAARGEALSIVANPLYGPELASKSTAGAANARNIATQESPEYAQALAEQEALRRTQLNPLEQGPVGSVAKATDTRTAGEAILPRDPLAGAAPSNADAVKRLAAEDPETTAALVRQNLADRYSAAQTETQSGSRETAGAKFHKSVAGNDERSALLDAVLRALPNNQASVTMPELLDVLQATMRRQGPGSATEPNRMITSELSAASPAAAVFDIVKSVGGSIINKAGDATKRAALRDGLETLADMFIAPNSIDLIRNARNNSGGRIAGTAAARTAAEAGGTWFDPRGAR
ncbi:hypothetical protein [Mesorhizobium sp. LSJC264A00]|uniref:hypothetical protein n=1 Tax=Mesorhizobium sp. LSJC264A00 TaxID=1287321 RepID=UPI0003CF261A|nr:hypothetical protein [Mesorhizobium sp. LSJC264A00]ESX23310.1 hypothetical protein X767_15960 [Mesorhizobium sp. LSJC264A00]